MKLIAPAMARPLRLAMTSRMSDLMVANLEMQEGVVFDAAPVAAIERFGADEIDRAGNGAAVAPGHDEQDVRSDGSKPRNAGRGGLRCSPSCGHRAFRSR